MTTQAALNSDLAQAVVDLQCNHVVLTPTVSSLLIDTFSPSPTLSADAYITAFRLSCPITHLATGAESVSRSIRDAWLSRGVRVAIDYGPSETTVGVVCSVPTDMADPTVSIGRPTAANKVYILDQTAAKDLVPLGGTGEICVAGEQVTPGYLQADLGKDVFVQHLKFGRIYRTGDLGRYLLKDQGAPMYEIECLGRKDSQVKINGLRYTRFICLLATILNGMQDRIG